MFGPGSLAALFIPPFPNHDQIRAWVFLFVSHLSAPSLCVIFSTAPLSQNESSRQYLFKYFSSPIIRLFPFLPFVSCSDKLQLTSQATQGESSFSLTRYSKKSPGLWCAIKNFKRYWETGDYVSVCVCVREEALLSLTGPLSRSASFNKKEEADIAG